MKKTDLKSCILTYGSLEFFFSAAPTAQNSPEFHFHFVIIPIQSAVLKSVLTTGLTYMQLL